MEIDNYNFSLALNAMTNTQPFVGVLPRTYGAGISGPTLAIAVLPDAQITDAPDNGSSLARAMSAAWQQWPTTSEWTLISTTAEPVASTAPLSNFSNCTIICQFNSSVS